jgi:hypothetical protein
VAGAIFCCFFVLALCSGEVAGQSLQKLLDGGRTPSAQKPQMSAAEQKDWAAAKVAELQVRESKADDLRSELRMANLPETRADEFLAALRESIRNYQLAADTLSAVVKRESPEGGLAPAPVALPKDEKEAEGYRDRLAALRGQVQTAATQVQLDEDFLTRQRSTLKALGAQLRRIQEQFDTAESPAAQRSAGFELKLAEMQQESASSAAFLGAWRLYADQLELRARQAEVRAVEEALSASGMDDIFDETRAQEAIKKTEREKASVQQLIAPARMPGSVWTKSPPSSRKGEKVSPKERKESAAKPGWRLHVRPGSSPIVSPWAIRYGAPRWRKRCEPGRSRSPQLGIPAAPST